MQASRKYFKNAHIQLFTNGLLLLQMDNSFWNACYTNNIAILATSYRGIQWDRIESKAAMQNVLLTYTSTYRDIIYGEKLSWHFPLDLSGRQDARENFLRCGEANTCIFLRNGRLYTCVAPPNIHHFNKYFNTHLVVSDDDSIDIYKAKDIREILMFLSKLIPFCRYCRVKDRKFDLPWKKSNKDIHEWI
ncbi:MAG: hypothetical protein LBR82_00085 [Desulfovibrio sp.]|nr:hypothetical protein [Desulfovibrio sp.]